MKIKPIKGLVMLMIGIPSITFANSLNYTNIKVEVEPSPSKIVHLASANNADKSAALTPNPAGREPSGIKYETAFTNSDIDNRVLNSSLPFGKTIGSHAVNPVGGASYNIPIFTPPGTHGLKPELSIAYNSMAGDGSMGMGWSISGFGAITRGNKDIFHDGAIQEMELVKEDAYYLNGERLRLVSGLHGVAAARYGTENETFSIIEVKNSNANGPLWWEVKMKNGLKYFYGRSSISSGSATNSTEEISGAKTVWRLSHIEDCNGNAMEFVYTDLGSEFVVAEINYTINHSASLTAYNSVEFLYTTRNDENTFFSKGSPINQKHLLEEIRVKNQYQVPVKKYKFNYAYVEGHSLLRELKELGKDNSEFNSTMFKYGDKPTNFSSTNIPTNGMNITNRDVITADFSGDGYTDIMTATFTIVGSIKKYTNIDVYRYNPSSSIYNLVFSSPYNAALLAGSNFPTFVTSDLNGDGMEDVLTFKHIFQGGDHKLTQIQPFLSDAAGSNFINGASIPTTGSFVCIPDHLKFIHLGDFDGDGRSDFLTILGDCSGSNFQVYLSLEGGADPNHVLDGNQGGYPLSSWGVLDDINIMDFNGDGKSDVMVTTGSTSRIYSIEKNGTNYETKQLYSGNFPTSSDPIFLADYNGDGKTDILSGNAASWSVRYSKGTDFYNVPINMTTNMFHGGGAGRVIPGDYNGDGRADILHMKNVGANSVHEMFLSNGFSFIQQGITASASPIDNVVVTGDFNADGRQDILNVNHSLNQVDKFFYKADGRERMVHKISDGYAFVTQFVYQPLTFGSDFYSPGAAMSYPFRKLQAPIYSTWQVLIPDGIGGIRNTIYSYEGALLHQKGKGFVGFEKFITKDLLRDRKNIHEFELNQTHVALAPKKQRLEHNSSGVAIHESEFTNVFVSLTSGRYWVKVTQHEAKSHVGNFRNLVNITYNALGDITMKDSYNGLPLTGGGSAQEHIVEEYGNFTYLCTGIYSHPQDITIKRTRNGETQIVKNVKKYYNLFFPYKTVEFAGTAEEVSSEILTYDAFGNTLTEEITSPGLVTQTMAYTYDLLGRYVHKEFNSLGQNTNRSLNPDWGLPAFTTSIDGLTTHYDYDAFGRLKESTDPLGNVTTHSRVWDLQTGTGTGTTSVQNALYHKTTSTPGFPIKEQYFDLYDRVRESRKESFNGQWTRRVYSFDNLGRAITKTTPFISGSSTLPIVTTTGFDTYDRPYLITNSANSTTLNYTYSTIGTNTKVTTTTNGNSNSKTLDPTGKEIGASDNGGSLAFQYDSWGNLTKTSLDGNTKATISYDPIYGRQTSLSDLDGGTTGYQYNAYGQLMSQTDANGNTSNMNYDAIGRITSTAGPEGTTTYDYVATGNGLNKLKKITGFNGITKEYTYDSYNRLQRLSVPFLTSFWTEYSYDSKGRMVDQLYSTDVRIFHIYNNYGYLEKIQSVENDIVNQQSVVVDLFEAQNVNAFGQQTQYIAGNGVHSAVHHNEFGVPTFYDAGSGAVQYLELNWDMSEANLSQRQDYMKAEIEDFQYDNFNRLAQADVLGGYSLSTTFDPNGNTDFHTNLNNFTYQTTFDDGQVKKIDNPNADISLLTQTLTYTSFNEPDKITEGIHEVKFNYGPDKARIQSVFKENGQVTEVRAYVQEAMYEYVIKDQVKKHIHYVNFPDKLGTIIVRCESLQGDGELPVGGSTGGEEGGEGPQHSGTGIGTLDLTGCNDDGNYNYFYTYSDHLGSILTVTNEFGNIVAEQSFDAWGRYRDPDTWAQISAPSNLPDWLFRGYTGHEKLDQFELIHMNGRLYAPKTNRMLSPDNFVQSPLNSQSHNRYSYAFNNPLKHTDPSGEIIGSLFTGVWDLGATVFTKGAIDPWNTRENRRKAWRDYDPTAEWSKTNRAWQIDKGLLSLDENRTFAGQVLQLVSRFTWEAPQTMAGNAYSHLRNIGGSVTNVEHYYGATVVNNNRDGAGRWGITLGNYINSANIQDSEDGLFRHEYGHTLQSRLVGPLYITRVGIPSLIGAILDYDLETGHVHDDEWNEVQADRMSHRYFGEPDPPEYTYNLYFFLTAPPLRKYVVAAILE